MGERARFAALALAPLLAAGCGSCGGGSADGRLSVDPDLVDFGSVAVSLGARARLRLEDTGSAPVAILRAAVSANLAAEVRIDAIPARLSPGETAVANAVFSPAGQGTRDGEIV